MMVPCYRSVSESDRWFGASMISDSLTMHTLCLDAQRQSGRIAAREGIYDRVCLGSACQDFV